MPGKRRVIGYIRVSKIGDRDKDEMNSMPVQRQKIEAECLAKGWELARIEEDLDWSGGNMERPGFQRALSDVLAGEADGIVCAYLSRFSRNAANAMETIKQIEAAGGKVWFGDFPMDDSTTHGKFLRGILLLMAEWQLDITREVFAESREFAALKGIHCARPPFGYRRAAEGRRLEVVQPEAALVRTTFEMRAAGSTMAEIAHALNAAGSSRRPVGGQWTSGAIRLMLQVETYTGDLVEGGRVMFKGAHPAIVSRDLWQRAQSVTAPAKIAESNPAMLTSIARCASCSYGLKPSHGRNGTRYYRCRQHHSTGTCPAPVSVRVDLLDGYVEKQFLASFDDPAFDAAADTNGDAEVEKEISDAQLELDAFLQTGLASVLGVDRYTEEVTTRQARLDIAREARRRAQRASLPHVGYRSLAEVWPTLDIPERRDVLRAALDAVFVKPDHASAVSDDRVFVAAKGVVTVELPSRGRVGAIRHFVFPPETPDGAGVLAA
jgi:site-specific DNA recombinase